MMEQDITLVFLLFLISASAVFILSYLIFNVESGLFGLLFLPLITLAFCVWLTECFSKAREVN